MDVTASGRSRRCSSCRVASARACWSRARSHSSPRVLLADEPATGLDPAHQLTLVPHFVRMASRKARRRRRVCTICRSPRVSATSAAFEGRQDAGAGNGARGADAEHLAAVYGIRATVTEIEGVRLCCRSNRCHDAIQGSIESYDRAAEREKACGCFGDRLGSILRSRAAARTAPSPGACSIGCSRTTSWRSAGSARPAPARSMPWRWRRVCADGGRRAARAKLRSVWEAVHKAGVPDLLRLNPFLFGLSRAPQLAHMASLWSALRIQSAGVRSPAPAARRTHIDFAKLRESSPVELLIAATEVASGPAAHLPAARRSRSTRCWPRPACRRCITPWRSTA